VDQIVHEPQSRLPRATTSDWNVIIPS
jgi:hypothetical protein